MKFKAIILVIHFTASYAMGAALCSDLMTKSEMVQRGDIRITSASDLLDPKDQLLINLKSVGMTIDDDDPLSGSKLDDYKNEAWLKHGNRKVTFNDLPLDIIRFISSFMEPKDIINWRHFNRLTLYSLNLKELVENSFNFSGIKNIADNEPELAGVMRLPHIYNDPRLFFKAFIEDVVNRKKPYKVILHPLTLHLFQIFPGFITANDAGWAIKYAALGGNNFVVELLLDFRTDIPANDAGLALQCAAMNGYKSIVELLLSRRTDISSE